MSEMDKAIYDSKPALPNKLLKEDGTITDLAGNSTIGAVDAYENKPALPNKWLNPDGSYSTLNEIIAGLIDSDIFVIVDELPATGETSKIYLLTQDNKLIEYLWVNDKWDPVGMVEFDIANYYTKAEVTQLISASLDSAKSYADNKSNTAEQNAKDYADTTKMNKKYATRAISTVGWYRVAQFKNQTALVHLWNNWNTTRPQEITMIVNSANSNEYTNIEILSCNNTNAFTKLRLVLVSGVIYLDAYYNVNANNNVCVEVFNNHNETNVLNFETELASGSTKFELNLSKVNITENIGTLSNLTTTDKTSLVNAINEVKQDINTAITDALERSY